MELLLLNFHVQVEAVLLEHTQLQSLVKAELAMLQKALQPAVLMHHLVNYVQHSPHRLAVISPRRH